MKPNYLSTELLNKTFRYFVNEIASHDPKFHGIGLFVTQEYCTEWSRVSKRSPIGKAFEEWLFAQGAGVRQINGMLYLEFVDEHEATLFTLKYI
jgi:hypothetical protein